jgi:hypothetical protein
MKKLIILAFAAIAAFASNLEIGQKFPFDSFENQHGKALVITNDTKKLIVAFTKKQGEVVKEFLAKNKAYLKDNDAVYLTDVSSVPSFVMSMFMLPKFKEYEYEMGLIKDEVKAQTIPVNGEQLTIIELNDFIITSISFTNKL